MQILAGLRRGEAPALTWDNIHECANRDESYIYIHRSQLSVKNEDGPGEHFVIVNHTKTYENRRFPITEDIRKFLEWWKPVVKEAYPDSNYLFPADTESGTITNNCVYEFYRRCCNKLGIKLSRDAILGPHSFRRNGITNYCNNTNGNIFGASLIYGNSPEVAKKYYYTGMSMSMAKAGFDGPKCTQN